MDTFLRFLFFFFFTFLFVVLLCVLLLFGHILGLQMRVLTLLFFLSSRHVSKVAVD